ncbi:MAG TPA: hypothetical protein VMU18_07680 [Rhodoblastus sp.]|nr:hypothetical protein [Rhodoblastus sp.]
MGGVFFGAEPKTNLPDDREYSGHEGESGANGEYFKLDRGSHSPASSRLGETGRKKVRRLRFAASRQIV